MMHGDDRMKDGHVVNDSIPDAAVFLSWEAMRASPSSSLVSPESNDLTDMPMRPVGPSHINQKGQTIP